MTEVTRYLVLAPTPADPQPGSKRMPAFGRTSFAGAITEIVPSGLLSGCPLQTKQEDPRQ